MLNKDEKLFMEYWDKNRERHQSFLYQLLSGLPFGLMFALPILVAVIFHGWYKIITYISPSQLVVITIAIFGISVFVGVFRMRFRWERNEQLYEELKFRESKIDAADI
ncbi:MAG: hypothetical protein ABIO82_06125 [Ginsengibacter sp.]